MRGPTAHGHDLAHVADRGCTHFGHGGGNRGLNLGGFQLTGQKLFDDLDFGRLFFGQFQPPALFIGARGFLTLFDHAAKRGQNLGLGNLAFATLTAVGDVTILDGGIDKPQRRQAVGLLGLHRLFQGGLKLVAQRHPVLSSWIYKRGHITAMRGATQPPPISITC